MPRTEYAEQPDGSYYVAGSRVSLASVIFEFRDGASPEAIRQNFPSLSFLIVPYRWLRSMAQSPSTSTILTSRRLTFEASRRNGRSLSTWGNNLQKSCKRSSHAHASVCLPDSDSASACGRGSEWCDCLGRNSPKHRRGF